MSEQPLALLLCDDLLFVSRIAGHAAAQGVTLQTVRNPELLKQTARQQAPPLIIVDLSYPSLDIGGLLDELRKMNVPQPYIVAYGSHVDTATLKQARAAGCNLVLPRSKFVEDLPEKLRDWVKGGE